MTTSEHVWKLDPGGSPDEWYVEGETCGHSGYECAICGASDCQMCVKNAKTHGDCIAMSHQATDPDDWADLVEQLRRYDRRAEEWKATANTRRVELGQAQKDQLKLKTQVADGQWRARQAEEKLADAECRNAQLRTRIAELELQIAQHEEAAHDAQE